MKTVYQEYDIFNNKISYTDFNGNTEYYYDLNNNLIKSRY